MFKLNEYRYNLPISKNTLSNTPAYAVNMEAYIQVYIYVTTIYKHLSSIPH